MFLSDLGEISSDTYDDGLAVLPACGAGGDASGAGSGGEGTPVYTHVMTTAKTYDRCRPRRACMQCRRLVLVFTACNLAHGKNSQLDFLSLFCPSKAIKPQF